MNKIKTLKMIGAASGLAAKDHGCGDGPAALQEYNLEKRLNDMGIPCEWKNMIFSLPDIEGNEKINEIVRWCGEIADECLALTKHDQRFVTLGGDHACAIGTWSGVATEISQQGPLGLIWVDAHMDAHTFETSKSGAIHGMPLAALLGHGEEKFTKLITSRPKLLPEHVCLIGVRSYEKGEEKLLKDLNVRIFDMNEINEKGLHSVFKEAIEIASKNTAGFGISIDLDAIDPKDAPGIGSPAKNGITAIDLINAVKVLSTNKQLLAAEIAEYNPHKDKDHKTAKIITKLLGSIFHKS